MEKHISNTKAKLGNAEYIVPETKELCIKALAQATRQLKSAIREELESKYLRTQHQNTIITQHEAAGNTKMAKKLKGMQWAEQVKHVFQ